MSQIVDEVPISHPAWSLPGRISLGRWPTGTRQRRCSRCPISTSRRTWGTCSAPGGFDVHHRRRGRRGDGRGVEERLRDRGRHGLLTRYFGEHARDGDVPRVARDVQDGRGGGRPPRHVRRACRHRRSDSDLHQPAQPQPSRRRAAGGQGSTRSSPIAEARRISTTFPCRSLARSTASSITAQLPKARTAASPPRSPATRSTGGFQLARSAGGGMYEGAPKGSEMLLWGSLRQPPRRK